MKTSDLIGPALDWAVAKALPDFNYKLLAHVEWPDDEYWVQCSDGVIRHHIEDQNNCSRNRRYSTEDWSPSTEWEQGGPIIEREKITWTGQSASLCRFVDGKYQTWEEFGPTTLIAAMRAYVASKLGPEVEIPEELR